MNHIEPTYLRFVFDKLDKGTINSDNPSSLPDGFVGIYEQEFMANTSVDERQNTLLKFGLWSLFKAAVSLETFSLIFNIDQSEVRFFIDTYSNWFNSPEPGKYQLYHDRIKVFFLQKLKDDEIKELNNNIINTIIKYLDSTESDIKHSYGLRFLGYHQLIEVGINKSFQDFINICLDRNFIEQQIKVSNSYVWSKEPIKQALKLATFHQNKKVVFELSKSLVNISSQEKDDLSDILTLIDNSEDQIVIERLNSIIDGSDDNIQISYILHILTIYSILENNKTSSSTERVNLYIRNIEDNFTENHDVIDQYMLISGNITLKVIYELYKISVESDFVFKRCSEIKVNPKNLAQYTFKELKHLYDLIQKFYGQKSSLSILCNIIEAGYDEKDFFSKEVLKIIDLNPDLISSLESLLIPLPEKLIQLTNDRRLINYFYEEYLDKGINKIPRSYYKSKFKFKRDSNLKDLLPFPDCFRITDISHIYNFDELQIISKNLSKWYFQFTLEDKDHIDEREEKYLDYNKNAQKLTLRTLVNKHDCNLSEFEKELIKYDIDEFHLVEIINHKKISVANKMWLRNFLKKEKNINKGSHTYLRYQQLKCHLLIHDFYEKKITEPIFLNRIAPYISENESFSELKELIMMISDYFNDKTTLNILKKLKNKDEKFLVAQRLFMQERHDHHFRYSDFSSLKELEKLANKLNLPITRYLYWPEYITANEITSEQQVKYLIEKVESIKSINNKGLWNVLEYLIDIIKNVDFITISDIDKINSLILDKAKLFNHKSWFYMTIAYLTEQLEFSINEIYTYYFQSFKRNYQFSNDLEQFLFKHKKISIEDLTTSISRKNKILYCIKNNLVEFFNNNLLIEDGFILDVCREFTHTELMWYLKRYGCKENIEMFIPFTNTKVWRSIYDQLELKNEIYYQITQYSSDNSELYFQYEISKENSVKEDQERYCVKIIIDAIKSIEDKSESFKILNQCIIELDKLDEDIIDEDTGEILDPNYEKVKALFFIINNFWKIGEKNIARQQLRSAYKFYNMIEEGSYYDKDGEWIKKLENLSLTVLDDIELKEFLKEKIYDKKIVSKRFIQVIYSKKFDDLISLWEQNLICLLKEKIERDVIDSEVRKYIKYNSLERAFVFGKQIKNQKNSIEWKNILIEYVDARSKSFKGDLSFDNYELVYNSIESTKVLENMLIYELFRDITSNIKKKKITNKYSGYATSHDIDEIFNTMKSLQAK